ncbi:MAG: hypothetical protein WCP97_06220 [bacterium]
MSIEIPLPRGRLDFPQRPKIISENLVARLSVFPSYLYSSLQRAGRNFWSKCFALTTIATLLGACGAPLTEQQSPTPTPSSLETSTPDLIKRLPEDQRILMNHVLQIDSTAKILRVGEGTRDCFQGALELAGMDKKYPKLFNNDEERMKLFINKDNFTPLDKGNLPTSGLLEKRDFQKGDVVILIDTTAGIPVHAFTVLDVTSDHSISRIQHVLAKGSPEVISTVAVALSLYPSADIAFRARPTKSISSRTKSSHAQSSSSRRATARRLTELSQGICL